MLDLLSAISMVDAREVGQDEPRQTLISLDRLYSFQSTVNVAINKLAGYEPPSDFRALIRVAHSNSQQRIHIIGALCEQLIGEGFTSVLCQGITN